MAATTSAHWYAMASSAERMIWARPVPRVRPTSVPRAYMSQCGAPRPAKAGTRYTPPVSAIEAAIRSESAVRSRIFSSSRSHCSTAPPMNTLPSRA